MSCARLFFFLLLPATLSAADESDAMRAMILAQEATVAAESGDTAAALEKLTAAVEIRPDFSRLLTRLAVAQLAGEKPDDAIATLRRLAAMGLGAPLDKTEEFAALRGRKEFAELNARFAANNRPQGRGQIAFALRDVTGLFVGLAWREKGGTFYFGDVHDRAVWVRGSRESSDNKPRRLTPAGDDLLGVFALAIDETNGALWAATAAVPEMRGYTPEMEGETALAEIDFASGEVRRVIPIPRAAGPDKPRLVDLMIAADGTIFATDIGSRRVWRLAPGAAEPQVFSSSAELMSPRGIAAAGDRSALFIADDTNGLLRADLRDGAIKRVALPADTTLTGIHALVAAPDGSLVGVQSGLRPNRIVRIELDATGEAASAVKVLEAAHFQIAAPGKAAIGPNGDVHFIGNSGASHFDTPDSPPSAPRAVAIFRTKPGG